MEKITMKELPPERQPYEKCLSEGADALSDAELLAVILRTGSQGETSIHLAQRILSLNPSRDGLLGLLHLSLPELTQLKGIGNVKAIQLICIGELSRRIWKRRFLTEHLVFTTPEEIAGYCMEDMRHLGHEEIHAMFFNTKQHLIKELLLSKGTVNASVLSPREVLIEALRCQAVTMALVHNHPSGDPHPSKEDISLTGRVREAASLVGIPLIDHIIIGDLHFYSFRKQNLL